MAICMGCGQEGQTPWVVQTIFHGQSSFNWFCSEAHGKDWLKKQIDSGQMITLEQLKEKMIIDEESGYDVAQSQLGFDA